VQVPDALVEGDGLEQRVEAAGSGEPHNGISAAHLGRTEHLAVRLGGNGETTFELLAAGRVGNLPSCDFCQAFNHRARFISAITSG
jgi:hypothetical protein